MSDDFPRLLHERHYTREEANAMLSRIEPLLVKLREARDELTDEQAHEALSDAAPSNGGGDPGTQVGQAFLEVRRLIGALSEAAIVVRDVDRGLIDFPSLLEDREVYLCWQLGEESVDYWHDLDAGYGGRQPLD